MRMLILVTQQLLQHVRTLLKYMSYFIWFSVHQCNTFVTDRQKLLQKSSPPNWREGHVEEKFIHTWLDYMYVCMHGAPYTGAYAHWDFSKTFAVITGIWLLCGHVICTVHVHAHVPQYTHSWKYAIMSITCKHVSWAEKTRPWPLKLCLCTNHYFSFKI